MSSNSFKPYQICEVLNNLVIIPHDFHTSNHQPLGSKYTNVTNNTKLPPSFFLLNHELPPFHLKDLLLSTNPPTNRHTFFIWFSSPIRIRPLHTAMSTVEWIVVFFAWIPYMTLRSKWVLRTTLCTLDLYPRISKLSVNSRFILPNIMRDERVSTTIIRCLLFKRHRYVFIKLFTHIHHNVGP
jgi:hypothetical protein